jgi:hypothetical protein
MATEWDSCELARPSSPSSTQILSYSNVPGVEQGILERRQHSSSMTSGWPGPRSHDWVEKGATQPPHSRTTVPG